MPVLTQDQFATWFEDARPELLAEARRHGIQDAEDLAQDCYLRAASIQSRFDADSGRLAFGRWLLRVLGNLIAERDRQPQPPLPSNIIDVLAAGHSEPALLARELDAMRTNLLEVIDRLGLSARTEVCLRLWLDGHTQQQIARYLMISQPTVSYHLQAARRSARNAKALIVLGYPNREIMFHECAKHATYRPPKQPIDRRGNAEQRQRRAADFHRMDREYETYLEQQEDRTVDWQDRFDDRRFLKKDEKLHETVLTP